MKSEGSARPDGIRCNSLLNCCVQSFWIEGWKLVEAMADST